MFDDAGHEELTNQPPTGADFIVLGERWISELDPPSVPIDYGRQILAAYRKGKLTSSRTMELLWGTVRKDELPPRDDIPPEGLRREFEPLR